MTVVAASLPRLGIIGGGQLARMTHQAAISLGVEVTVLCDDPGAPAVLAGARHLHGSSDCFDDLRRLAEAVDVVTLDHERTPAASLARLSDLGHRVAPGPTAALLGQDKAEARRVLGARGVAVAPWVLTRDAREIEAFAARNGPALVLKRATGAYDGRGVWVVGDARDAAAIVAEVGGVVVEPLLACDHELAVVVVRSRTGEVATYPPFETVQRDGQCDEVFVPASVPGTVGSAAAEVAVRIALLVDLVGVMAVELFVVDGRLLLNELAVRPHNSGHVTMEACLTSQFENHVRAVLGLPLGAVALRVPAACMANVTGAPDGTDPFEDMAAALAVPGVALHRYAKAPRPRRKLGHITATGRDVVDARHRAHGARRALLAPEAVR